MTITIIIAAVVLALIGIINMQPSDFRVTRQVSISAPAATVFAQVNDFHNWIAWSDWEKHPSITRTYDGPSAGTGAVYSWVSKMGEGRMTILESRPSELVTVKLENLKPMACTNLSEFTFKSEGGQPAGNNTVVTWTMTGSKNFIMKAFGMAMNMDKMLGGDFEKGLAAMKSIAEKRS